MTNPPTDVDEAIAMYKAKAVEYQFAKPGWFEMYDAAEAARKANE